jgi:DNA-binding beta-propeller fold protein YncE
MDDRIVIFDPEGTRIARISIHDLIADAVAAERWQAIEATIAEGKEDVLLQDGSPSDVYHTNSIQFVSWGPEEPRTDALLVSIRELGTLAVIDLTARTVIWRWGRGELESQHHATLQPNGRVLVFDNGRVRERSRVLEIDPLTNTFTELPTGPAFFTETRGGVERCPNGNLLVADSNSGRVFEVTPDGALAWEFWNPDFKGRKRAAVYRMARLPLSTWENLRAAIAVE